MIWLLPLSFKNRNPSNRNPYDISKGNKFNPSFSPPRVVFSSWLHIAQKWCDYHLRILRRRAKLKLSKIREKVFANEKLKRNETWQIGRIHKQKKVDVLTQKRDSNSSDPTFPHIVKVLNLRQENGFQLSVRSFSSSYGKRWWIGYCTEKAFQAGFRM